VIKAYHLSKGHGDKDGLFKLVPLIIDTENQFIILLETFYLINEASHVHQRDILTHIKVILYPMEDISYT
jgi:hypothetical protein